MLVPSNHENFPLKAEGRVPIRVSENEFRFQRKQNNLLTTGISIKWWVKIDFQLEIIGGNVCTWNEHEEIYFFCY